MKNKNLFISVGVLLIGLLLAFFIWQFNESGKVMDKYLLGNVMLLFFIPILTIFFVFFEDVREFGFKMPENPKIIWSVTGICMVLIVIILYFPSKWPQFQEYYPIFKQFNHPDPLFFKPNPFASDFGKMFFAEASYCFYMFCWEFFFRGYMTCGMSKSFGLWAVLIQTVPFTLLHVGKPIEETVSSFFAGLILGLLAYYGRSFIPCFIIHSWVFIMFDIMVIMNR